MKKITTHPRIVEALIDSDVTIKGQRFVEYFNDPGKFYPENLEKPTGIGVYFQNKNSNKDWIESGKVKIVDIVHIKDTKWWAVIKDNYLQEIRTLISEKQYIQARIDHLEMILIDPITHYSKELVNEDPS